MDLRNFARRYMRPYTAWYGGGTLAVVVTNALSVTIPLYLADGIDALTPPDGASPDMDRVAWDAMTVAAMGLLVIAVRTGSRALFFTPGRLVESAMKRDLFERILRHQPAFLRRWPTGDLMSRTSSDVNLVRLLAGFGALQIINTTVSLSLASAQMVRLSADLALWVVGPVLLGFAVTQLFIQRLFALIRRSQEEMAAVSDLALTSFRGIDSIQGFAAEDAFSARFADRNRRWLATSLGLARVRTTIGPVLSTSVGINIFLLLYAGGARVIDGRLTIGELVAFTTLVGFVAGPLRSMSFLLSMVKQGQAALERIDAVLGPEPHRPDLPGAVPPPDMPPSIEIRSLTFRYPGEETAALADLDLTVAPGTTLGVLGLTGAGKTTLLRLLARLEDPPPGTVFVDGVDLRSVDLDAWRARSTLVPQRPFLFSERLADNVLMGGSDPDRLEEAIALASLRPDVDALPDGVDTVVGEAGVMLSGGQRQRTALARGLIRDHVLLALDDVLSAVDHATEAELIAALRRSGTTPTTIIVAHRVSALRHAEQIIVLDEGRVVDRGTHAELASRPGLYQETWDRQREEERA